MGKNGTENGYLHLKGDQDAKGKEDRLPVLSIFFQEIFMCFQRGKLWVIGKLIIGQLIQVYLMHCMNRTYRFVSTHNY